jgi:hypothetical protein
VPTIDECVLRDMPCVFEANEQYKRDKYVKLIILDTWGGSVTFHIKVYTDSVMGYIIQILVIHYILRLKSKINIHTCRSILHLIMLNYNIIIEE